VAFFTPIVVAGIIILDRCNWETANPGHLDRERKAMTRLWAKREEQIRGVVESTAGLYGDLQGIAGHSLLEIDGPMIESPKLPPLENLWAI
jgi:hypothetical protein